MVRGMVDRDRERIHRLAELLCQKFEAPLNRELIESRAFQVLRGASKKGARLTHAECVIYRVPRGGEALGSGRPCSQGARRRAAS